MTLHNRPPVPGIFLLLVGSLTASLGRAQDPRADERAIDNELRDLLAAHGFTGRIEQTLELRLGRAVDEELADLGRILFFDPIMALRRDNSCSGCHAPQFGFGDSQSIAIGVMNNDVVGPSRTGPRNQRRSPIVMNSAFYPALMWNTRFFAQSADPFDNSLGFAFPDPEGITRFPPDDPEVTHLLAAQGHIPQTELVEMTGFAGVSGSGDINPRLHLFDDGVGIVVPGPDESGFRNEPIRDRVLEELNANAEYVERFAAIFPDVAAGAPIRFSMVGAALAEFQISLTFANAPIDRFARGHSGALTPAQKRGAILFFGRAGCVQCHAVSGFSSEMFSDFANHNIGVPQIAPTFGIGAGNVIFDGPGEDEDFGLAQITGNAADRYKFRTSPLRNVALQPTFFHNGAFTRLEDAIAHHLDVQQSALNYEPSAAGVDGDLHLSLQGTANVLESLDPLIAQPLALTDDEFMDLVVFVRFGLLDPRATPDRLATLIPIRLPSGLLPHTFEPPAGPPGRR